MEKLYLLGHPVGHSKSPAMYNAVYRAMGLPWEYGLMDISDATQAEAFLESRDYLALNITTPYKPHAFAAATHKAASAKLAQGANVLVRKGDALLAYNTDGKGCVVNLERAGFSFDGARVVVCGTGPTALAIVHAAALAGAAEVVLLSRSKERAGNVLKGYASQLETLATSTVTLGAAAGERRSLREAYRETKFKFGAYETSSATIQDADLVVNATPLGMKAGDPAPFDGAVLHEGQAAFDVVYAHGQTAFAAAARAAGCTFLDGAGMLVGQAVASARITFDLAGVEGVPTDDELFALMAGAAGFAL